LESPAGRVRAGGDAVLRDAGWAARQTGCAAGAPIDAALQPVIAAGQFSYLRLHGHPRRYYSSYSADYLAGLVAGLAARLKPAADGPGACCIFDNTAGPAAWPDAIQLKQDLLRPAYG
jgi:uncharacterized protein YecE (DUF72 family)